MSLQNWQLPLRRVMYPRISNPKKPFVVTLNSASDQDALERAQDIFKACHPNAAAKYGAPEVSEIVHSLPPATKHLRDYERTAKQAKENAHA